MRGTHCEERGIKQECYCGPAERERPVDIIEEGSNSTSDVLSLGFRGEIGLEILLLWSTAYLA